jgi:hypothetical protein
MTDKEGGDNRAGYLYFDMNRSKSISFILESQNTFLLAFCELRALLPWRNSHDLKFKENSLKIEEYICVHSGVGSIRFLAECHVT